MVLESGRMCRANIGPRRTGLVRYIITRLLASARPNWPGARGGQFRPRALACVVLTQTTCPEFSATCFPPARPQYARGAHAHGRARGQCPHSQGM